MFWIKTIDVLAVVTASNGSYSILFCDGQLIKNVDPVCAEKIIVEIKTPKRLG